MSRGRVRVKPTPHLTGNPTQGATPGPQDHDLSRRRALTRLSPPGSPKMLILYKSTDFLWPSYKTQGFLFLNQPYKEWLVLYCHNTRETKKVFIWFRKLDQRNISSEIFKVFKS